MVSFGNWISVVAWVAGLLVSAVLVIGALAGGLWLLRKLIAPSEYGSLTMLLAVIGGLVALYQADANAREKVEDKARSLQFATETATKLLFLATFQDRTGEVDPTVIEPSLLARTHSRVQEYVAALNAIDPKSLPTAATMDSLSRVKAAAKDVLLHTDQALNAGKAANLDFDIAMLGNALEELRVQRDALYPVYKVGPIAWGKLPSQR